MYWGQGFSTWLFGLILIAMFWCSAVGAIYWMSKAQEAEEEVIVPPRKKRD